MPPPTLDLPALPDDIKLVGERAQSMLQARRGQIVQVSKENATSEWLYGNVIYDPHGSSAAGSSGWFPRLIVQQATPKDMQVLAQGMGSTAIDALATPWTVDYMDKRHNIDISRFKVLKSGYELDENINKLIDKFPTPEEFYYEDVSGIDMPHYIHG